MKQIQSNLKRWRKLKGLTQDDLARKAGVSRQGYMKIERGDASPRTETLAAIAKVLEIPIPELLKEEPKWESLRFRTGKSETQKIRAERTQTLIEIYEWLNFYNEIEKELNELLTFNIRAKKSDSIKTIAKKVREELNFDPDQPIPDLFESIEKAGIKLFLMHSDIPNLFGLSIGEKDGGPCIAININKNISIERQIFTAAHELGHLILHKDSYMPNNQPRLEENPKEEAQANEFASYFLMPQNALEKEWNDNLGLHWIDRILKIKKYFKVSYKTVLMRLASQLDDNEKQKLFMKFNIEYNQKYNHDLKNHFEPESISANCEPQKTGIRDLIVHEERFERIVRKALEKSYISVSKASVMLRISPDEMRELADSWSEEQPFFGK